MDYPLHRERQGTAVSASNPLLAVIRWFATARAKRAQRLALARLLELDSALLRDIGLERQDVAEVMRLPHAHAASLFETRRREASEELPRR